MFALVSTVRWRIALLCAGLTMLILIAFAAVLGTLLTNRIEEDRASELNRSARSLAGQVESRIGSRGQPIPVVSKSELPGGDVLGGAVYRVIDPFNVTRLASSPAAETFASPSREITEANGLVVATARISSDGQPAGFVQFGKPAEPVDSTISRIWLFLGLSVVGGTALALLAGLTVAGQAMKPITSLTRLARKVQQTGDPSEREPVEPTDDEVGELAETFEEMLESIEAAEMEREEIFARQREFVADASHELRTPLTSIQLNLEMLRDGHDEEGVAVPSALESTRRMSGLVSDLLLLARSDAGTRQRSRAVDLPSVIRAAVAEVGPIAGSRRIDLVESPCPSVSGDPDALQRATRNLIENAIKHTPDETRIEVTARPTPAGAEIVVRDDGPGIPPGMTERVFERFTRADGAADTSSSDGSGLGLAIVEAIARSHGGEASARNIAGGGVEFRISLPVAAST